ncbi:purine-nucleoside phosphorylase [Desulfurobacterium indicum]|uniref:Purine nucleoside phosphorylase n=1 Tax=Desulfurobacterium indicum TaxID=1914305 RepID=A0A1R1MM94_9BACT|nr:purine-nucleoside phosphorylase [Desulfurobacterium indicum]OMH40886.1 purine-nucleoside phosphorylase [Desulfurobacterium indicum]
MVNEAALYIKERCGIDKFDVAIVLGSGVELGEVTLEIPYKDVPGMPLPAVPGHKGVLKVLKIDRLMVAVFSGRFHYYEGRSNEEIRFIPELSSLIGCKLFIATCAVGAVSRRSAFSQLVVVEDHINLIGKNPLTGLVKTYGSEVFVDMKSVYDRKFIDTFLDCCFENDVPAISGVLAAVHGPNYESFAEIKMLSMLGADVVSMSTVPEIIAAKFYGMKVAAVAVVANDTIDNKTTHEEVLKRVELKNSSLGNVLKQTLMKLYNYI